MANPSLPCSPPARGRRRVSPPHPPPPPPPPPCSRDGGMGWAARLSGPRQVGSPRPARASVRPALAGSGLAQPLGRAEPGARGPRAAGSRRPRPPRGPRARLAPSRHNLATLPCLQLFIKSPEQRGYGRASCAPVVWLLRAAHMLNRLTCLG